MAHIQKNKQKAESPDDLKKTAIIETVCKVCQVKPNQITTKFNDDGKEYIFTVRKIIAFMLITETHISKTNIGKLLNVTRVQAYNLKKNLMEDLIYQTDTKKPVASVEKLLKCYEEYRIFAEINELDVKFKM